MLSNSQLAQIMRIANAAMIALSVAVILIKSPQQLTSFEDGVILGLSAFLIPLAVQNFYFGFIERTDTRSRKEFTVNLMITSLIIATALHQLHPLLMWIFALCVIFLDLNRKRWL